MTRTLDPAARVEYYFKRGVKTAVSSMLREMISHGVQVAIVPAVSMGLYSGDHRVDFMGLVSECVREIGNMGSIERVVVSLHPASPQMRMT